VYYTATVRSGGGFALASNGEDGTRRMPGDFLRQIDDDRLTSKWPDARSYSFK
jgi:hypothetical protein